MSEIYNLDRKVLLRGRPSGFHAESSVLVVSHWIQVEAPQGLPHDSQGSESLVERLEGFLQEFADLHLRDQDWKLRKMPLHWGWSGPRTPSLCATLLPIRRKTCLEVTLFEKQVRGREAPAAKAERWPQTWLLQDSFLPLLLAA